MKSGSALKVLAFTNITFTSNLGDLLNRSDDLVFPVIGGGLLIEPLRTGTYVLTNDPPSHPAFKGTPPGHPPIHSYLGLPLYSGKELVGVIGLANSSEGFWSDDFARFGVILTESFVFQFLI